MIDCAKLYPIVLCKLQLNTDKHDMMNNDFGKRGVGWMNSSFSGY